MNLRTLSATLTALTLTATLAGCNGTPNIEISSTTGTDFGSVALSLSAEKEFTVTNIGDEAVVIGEISAEGLGLAAPFSWTGGTCATGATIAAKGGNCTVIITFAPTTEGRHVTTISLNFTEEKDTDQATLEISGKGFLDCNIRPELTEGRANGVLAAKNQMADDAVRGKLAGEALTYDNGASDGYSAGYHAGFRAGYDSPSGYNAGYNQGKDVGFFDGTHSISACSSGSVAGSSDGHYAGTADGQYDGYTAGYQDGQPNGNYEGYNVGYSDGANSCTEAPADDGSSDGGSSKTSETKLTSTDPLVDACYQQGYNATYSNTAYWNAYDDAKAHNVAYQSGYSTNYPIGNNTGKLDGIQKGYDDGYADGYNEAYHLGTDVAYTECYNQSYNAAYNESYEDGFHDLFYGYDAGYDDGYADGYTSGYSLGYTDGEFDYCGSDAESGSPDKTLAPKKFGKNQTWWVKTSDGKMADKFIRSKKITSESNLLRETLRSELRAKKLQIKASNPLKRLPAKRR